MVAHETERLGIKLEEASPRHQVCECEHKGGRAVCRAVAPAVAPAPSAADGTSCGDSWRHQLAAEALVNMAWTAAGRQGTLQQQSLRTADQQQRSTMDSPATPNQEPCSQEPPCDPMPLAYGTPVEHGWHVHSQPLGPGALFAAAQHAPLHAPPLLHQCGPYIQYAAPPYSIAPQPPSPYSIAPPPPMDPYSIAGPPQPPPTVYGSSPYSRFPQHVVLSAASPCSLPQLRHLPTTSSRSRRPLLCRRPPPCSMPLRHRTACGTRHLMRCRRSLRRSSCATSRRAWRRGAHTSCPRRAGRASPPSTACSSRTTRARCG